MLGFLDLNKFVKGLDPVTSSELLSRTGDFHPTGLFSESIFGPIGSLERRKTYSFINLNSYVIHPTSLQLLLQLDRKIDKMLSTEISFTVDSGGRLIEDPNGITGIDEFIKIFPKIKFRGETKSRERFIIVLKKSYDEGTLFINKLPVIPPDFRPAFKDERGELIIDKLNEYYITVLRRALQIKSAGKGPLYDLLNYGIQLAVVDHDNFIRTKISKKAGIIRGNLLAKRVEFSGRAVITPGPELKVNEVGVPMILAVSLFEPFLLHVLLHTNYINKDELENEIKSFTGLDLSVDSIRRVLRSIKARDTIPENLYRIFAEATEIAMKDRVVICKRDPDLHSLSMRAFYPKLVHGISMQLCTLQVGGFNADFDGDTMAIYHPLTDEAQQEAKEKMMRAAAGSSSTKLTFNLSKEMWVGLYVMTKPSKAKSSPVSISLEDLEKATNPFIPVVFKNKSTTMGRALFNSCLPKNYPFIDQQVTKKLVSNLIYDLINKYDEDVARESASRLERLAFKFATIIATSVTIDDLTIPREIYKLKEKLVKATPEQSSEILSKMREILIDYLQGTGFYDFVESGASKGWDQPMQILAAKGIIADPTGKILPSIRGSFSEGLTNTEYFNATAGARKGIIDRVLNTADTGYMSRQLVYVLSPVEASPTLKDCKTERTLDLRLERDLMDRFSGRNIVRGTTIQKFSKDKFKPGDLIRLRTPIYCRSKKVCHTCYGDLLYKHKTPYIGVLAAQTVGEVGTQLIMRTFHAGGVVKLAIRDILVDIAENDQLTSLATIQKYLKQTENSIICNSKCKIIIDPTEYDMGDNIEINDEDIWLRGCIAKVEFSNIIFNIILDYQVEFNIPKENNITKEIIELVFEAGEVLFSVPLEAQEMKENVLYVKRLLSGREVYSNIEHLYKKLFKIYGPLSDMDSVHLEVLLSQCLRDRSNLAIPARLGKTWDPEMLNIKKAIFSSGFVQGLAFENINEAIKTGLISPDVEESSVIEKILTGTLVVKEE